MKEKPLLSIIIDSYNYGGYLGEAIDSALNQTYNNTEVIVVDDGSTDNSLEVISTYGSRITSILKENGGQASALNAGFRICRGDVVIFLDSDDYLFPEAAGEVVKGWRPEVVCLQYQLRVLDSEGQWRGIHPPVDKMPREDLRDYILKAGDYPSPPTSGLAFSRSVLEELLPMPEADWTASCDNYLRILTPFIGDVIFLSKPLGAYRVHGNNITVIPLDQRLKATLAVDYKKEKALWEFASKKNIKIPNNIYLDKPRHYKRRISSLRLNSEKHPYPEDRRTALCFKGIRAVWKFPKFTVRKKYLFSLWFLFVAFLPLFLIKSLIVRACVEWRFVKGQT